MARLKGAIDLAGKLGGLSIFKRIDMDGSIVRMPGGATKNKIKNDKNFARTRENNLEWKGVGKAAGNIRKAVIHVKHLADHNITNDFSTLCKKIQLQDTENERGKRSILLSKHRDLLEGYHITRINSFDGVVRLPLKYEIDKQTGSAWVQFPNLTPEINLFIPWQYPVFRFIISLQAVRDLHHDYANNDTMAAPVVYTAWKPTAQNYTGERIAVQFEEGWEMDDSWTLILSVGLEIGNPISNNYTAIAKRAGSAKILALA
ncbi:hypothetical protein SAMN05518672_108145 [Chitinophaga sp. CF118]|uniref:hypothetical protein n=1 Tax=Chitinophaga sp. CF118 TaxID=1884367 RepID=UPI0008F394E2|nr:hypothetical protein [Chitinophaga sp. CF118]SFE62480.1 hypothetical protein SAMN05518672_108145 [Chitinophaga sp. CF118]